MNHERFGWQDDERPDSDRGGPERGRYPRGRGYSDQGGRSDYDDMTYNRGPQRDDMPYGGRSYQRDGNDMEQDRGQRGGYGYGSGRLQGDGSYGGTDRDRDSQGRFVSESNRGQGRGNGGQRMMGGGYGGQRMTGGGYGGAMRWDEGDRDSFGRYPSERDGGGDWYGDWYGGSRTGSPSYRGGYDATERERDSMGRFVSESYDQGRMSGMSGQRSGMSGRNKMGRHTGRGPKNYQRSDERIREEVSDKLEQDGDIDASEMEIKVQNGLVTLSGSVETRQEKRMAEELAEECSGVKDVQNLLKVSGRQGENGKQAGSQQGGTHQGDQKEHGRKSA